MFQDFLNGTKAVQNTILGVGQLGAQAEATPTIDYAARAAASDAAAKRNAANPLLASLDSLNTILANKNQQTVDEYGRVRAQYDASDALDRTNYDQNLAQNETAYTGNNQAALLNAANASTGLRGALSSMNALAGSGVNILKKLVGLAANSDTGAARDTFEVNSKSLNQNWSRAEEQQRQRRADAEATRENNLRNNEANVLSSRQSIFQQLANVFGADTAEGTNYASQATALAAPIAATTRASVAPYAGASSLFSPAALQDYLAGTQNLNVATAGGNSAINSPTFTTTGKRKDQLSGVA